MATVIVQDLVLDQEHDCVPPSACLREWLARLPELEREAVKLHVGEGHSYRVTGELLRVSHTTARRLVRRAWERLFSLATVPRAPR